ncbi:hypothetical protein LPJ61_005564, partial [Coemansia biformis]
VLGIDDVDVIESLVVRLVRDSGTLSLTMPGVQSLVLLLGSKTEQFLNELAAFMDSTLDMHNYDVFTAYDTQHTA